MSTSLFRTISTKNFARIRIKQLCIYILIHNTTKHAEHANSWLKSKDTRNGAWAEVRILSKQQDLLLGRWDKIFCTGKMGVSYSHHGWCFTWRKRMNSRSWRAHIACGTLRSQMHPITAGIGRFMMTFADTSESRPDDAKDLVMAEEYSHRWIVCDLQTLCGSKRWLLSRKSIMISYTLKSIRLTRRWVARENYISWKNMCAMFDWMWDYSSSSGYWAMVGVLGSGSTRF